MPGPNLFEELKESLTKFKTFLHDNVSTIKPAVQALKAVVPQVTELIDKLIDLLGKLKTEINKINPGSVGQGLTKVTEFTKNVKTLLETSKGLLPNEAAKIDDVIKVADVVSSLPSLDAVKEEIKKLIDDIVADLNQLKA
jgi:hypothetical protein